MLNELTTKNTQSNIFSTFQGPEGERLRQPEQPEDQAAQRRAEEPPQGQRRACPLLHGQVE